MNTYEIVCENDPYSQYLIVLEEIRVVRLKPYTNQDGWRFVLPDKYAHQVYEDLRIRLNQIGTLPVCILLRRISVHMPIT